jgi:hypothetical protein
MQAFTVSAAACLCGVDRRTLQRAIQAGRLPLDAQHCLAREALIAAGYLDAVPPQEMPHGTPQDTSQFMPQDTPQELMQATALLALLERLTTAITDLHAEVCSLREDLRRRAQRTPQGRRRDAPPTPQATPQDTPQWTPQATPQAPARRPRGHRAGLPREILEAIAAERRQQPRLSLRAFAMWLYDQGLYRAKGDKPVDASTLRRWLGQAGIQGLL